MQVQFSVPGLPRGKQRARTVKVASGRTVTYTPEQTVLYENLVRWSYKQQCGAAFLEGAIEADITAYFPIPKSESKKNKEKMLAGNIFHVKKIDADNLAKSVLDSLNQIAYRDDAQVALLTVRKLYGEQPRVDIKLREIMDNEN